MNYRMQLMNSGASPAMTDDAGPVVVVVAPGAEAEGGSGESGEVQGSAEVAGEEAAEVVEAVADSAVEIARIEADRDVTLAVINAETTEAIVDASHQQELEEWRTRAMAAETLNTELRATLDQLTQPPPEPEPPSPSDPPHENSEAAHVPAQVESPAPEPPPAKRRSRWI